MFYNRYHLDFFSRFMKKSFCVKGKIPCLLTESKMSSTQLTKELDVS